MSYIYIIYAVSVVCVSSVGGKWGVFICGGENGSEGVGDGKRFGPDDRLLHLLVRGVVYVW